MTLVKVKMGASSAYTKLGRVKARSLFALLVLATVLGSCAGTGEISTGDRDEEGYEIVEEFANSVTDAECGTAECLSDSSNEELAADAGEQEGSDEDSGNDSDQITQLMAVMVILDL